MSKRVTVRKRKDFSHAGKHPLPRALVLYHRPHSNTEFIGSPQDKVRVAQELAREQDGVRLALRQDVVRLLRRRDHSHGAHDNVRVRLLDRLRERDLRERCENASFIMLSVAMAKRTSSDE